MPSSRTAAEALESGETGRDGSALKARYDRVRAASLRLSAPLKPEDQVVQSMPDVSPTKWHLAHTSWFFEQFLLQPYLPKYRVFDEDFGFLFNSYYESVGPRHARPLRGLLTRPGLQRIHEYRAHVDEHMRLLLEKHPIDTELFELVELGLNHEQQHQELMLTDIKHVLSCNPLEPAYRSDLARAGARAGDPALRWVAFDAGLCEIGTSDQASFCFDNEMPRHKVWNDSFEIANRLVTNAEILEFIRDGGYQTSLHWLSDGWAVVQQDGWRHPLYWDDALQSEFTLGGRRDLDPAAPVSHLSYYEADAFARWAGARLPTEAEWEIAVAGLPMRGNFVENDRLHPFPEASATRLAQFYGDAWEWTASPYSPYPGFHAAAGAVGEYNGKFMCNQIVLRGGSCVTPADHMRPTYRNFFYPHARWQFMGLRLARNSS